MQIICLIILFSLVNALAQSDIEALLELKKGIQKDPSGQVLSTWVSKSSASDGCPLNWQGIMCSEGNVISINLNDIGLVGDFDFHSVNGLRMLQNLTISNNQFTGNIFSIGSMESIQYLDISQNNFHGLLPSDLVQLNNLVSLNLSFNQFEGSLPHSFGKLEQLKYLDLQANNFSGDIMHLVSQMGRVVYVGLSSNMFFGSLDLGRGNSLFVSSIRYFNISDNVLVGELFAHDGMPYFDSLEVFDASNNQLVGVIPPFNFIVSLQILRLGNNLLSGPLPESLLQDSSLMLSELDISRNMLEGSVGSITSPTLKKLNLSSNKLSGPLPLKVGHCTLIDLSDNLLSGDLSRIQYWGNYVEIIQLSSNSLKGVFPNQTSQFLRLTELKMSNNSLEGGLPLILGTYPELKVIDLSLNQISGYLLPNFFKSTILTDINLSNNRLSGLLPFQDIPNNLGVTSPTNLALISLDLSCNNLSGNLPPEISKFHNLAYLNLSNNEFDGSILDKFPDGLRELNLSFNNFSGVVPEKLIHFPESAFRPGNPLLTLPHSSSPPPTEEIHGLDFMQHEVHFKFSIRIALIACLVGGVCMLVLLGVIIYYRDHLKIFGCCSKQNTQKRIPQGAPSASHELAHKRNVESLSSSSFITDPVYSSEKEPEQDAGVVQSVAYEVSYPECSRQKEGMSVPPSSPSYSHLSKKPSLLQVYSPDRLVGELHLFDSSLMFTELELSLASAEIIGRSCHGTLYKATLASGLILAFKWLREEIVKGKKDFCREIKKLDYIKHTNLVPLQGYYWGPNDGEILLISSYIDAISLNIYLHDADQTNLEPLSIHERLKVATDIARCLNYLHSEKAIPHGNLKSTNILLAFPNKSTLLSDYSLHRVLNTVGTAEQVLNAGALGYLPPEFASSSKPSPSLKGDVYAFGVIMLELLTGKCAGEIVSGMEEMVDLTDWVTFLARVNRATECFDRLLLDQQHKGEHTLRVLDHMLQVALRCVLPASERPEMQTIFEDLSTIR